MKRSSTIEKTRNREVMCNGTCVTLIDLVKTKERDLVGNQAISVTMYDSRG